MRNEDNEVKLMKKTILSVIVILSIMLISCQKTPEKTIKCEIEISCASLINNDSLDPDTAELIPSDGMIVAPITVEIAEGSSAYDILEKVCKDNKLQIKTSKNLDGSVFVEEIYNIKNTAAGDMAGWSYTVNGEMLMVAASNYILSDGDSVRWEYVIWDFGE